MKFKYPLLAALVMTSMAAQAGVVTLDGMHLTQEQAWSIAEGKDTVEIAPEALQRLKDAHELVMTAAKGSVPVYGLTTGVGMNKDRPIFDAHGELSQEVIQASKNFNRFCLRSHSGGYGDWMSDTLARLTMVIRLNTMLAGNSGAQPYVAELFKQFINKGVTPLVPTLGSVGEADITLGAHIGSVMVGEWRARVDGKEVSGAEALKMKNIKPLDPIGKDFLAIFSSNAPAVAETMQAARTARKVIDMTPLVFALTLEGFNGNIAPFLPQVIKVHNFVGLEGEASKIRASLKGSYLWKEDKTKALQDPLSFRTSVYTMREARLAMDDLDREINVQINSSDDNPATILNADDAYAAESDYVAKYFVKGDRVKGAIIPSANFNPLPVAIAAQRLTMTLAHLTHNSAQRITHLGNDSFTGLTRWLIDPSNKGYGFGAIQKTMISLQSDTIAQTAPVSMLGLPAAGGIEDTFTNLPLVAERLDRAANNTAMLYSFELLNSTQAIDMRTNLKGKFTMAGPTKALYKAYRAKVPYVKADRIYTDNLRDGKNIILNYKQ